ncbi:hypothetical protein lerEdw1_018325 [Lerista edwardsae]|nr:hypothetical protein lerEdw1_018325 [Lerista edwardsae]
MLSSGLRIPLLPPLLLLLLSAMELSWSFTDDQKKLIVDLHNEYRSQVSPPAADMLKMSWDPQLEAFAKDYAAKCTWEHNKARGRRGENLFAMSGGLDVKIAVESWYNEYQYYNMTTLECEEGQMCGHYTQVVWATSERVGCGTVFCETLHILNDTDMDLVVCNYEPPGNVKGRKPYKEGAPCSMCPDGYSCKNSLCESSVDLEAATPSLELSASPESISEAESASPVPEGPDSSPEPTLDLHTTAPALQGDAFLMTTGSAPTTDVDLTLATASPETGTKPVTYTGPPSSGGLVTSKASGNNFEPPPTTLVPLRSTPKSPTTPKLPSTPKPPSTPKRPPSSKFPSAPKPPSFPKPLPIPKPPAISKSPARHRLMAYAKAIRRHSNTVQTSAKKSAALSVCLPCLGCKQISRPEEIQTALKELTFRYPYAPCFSPLPRWQRHSKCSWCGHTWGNVLRRARPYWLNSL